MLPLDHPDRIQITFDDRRLVANAGLLLPVTLAQHLGLRELVDHHLDLGNAPGRANAGDKMLTLVASALAGGDCIDDADVLRTGGTAQTLGCVVKAPSTLGTFLRSFRWGHVRQLDRVSRELLARAWSAGAGPGDAPFTIDLDSTICETYGLAKEGARDHGYTGKRGYHPLLAVAAGTGDVLMARLREGRANTARGAAHFLRETVGRVRYAGARGQLTVRADSGFYTHAIVAACRRMDVRFSITIRQSASLRSLIEAIPEQDWTPIPYWMEGAADVAETSYTPFQSKPDAAPVRLIVRRVKPTPGSQLALFATYSYHGFITDREGETPDRGRYGLKSGCDIAWVRLTAIRHLGCEPPDAGDPRCASQRLQMQKTIETSFTWRKQLTGLALWVCGAILGQRLPERQPPSGPWSNWYNLRQRLREWLYDGGDRATPCQTELDVTLCFAPRCGGSSAGGGRRLGLGHQRRTTAIGRWQCAIPVAWHTGTPTSPAPGWTPPWNCCKPWPQRFPRIPTVIVLCDWGVPSCGSRYGIKAGIPVCATERTSLSALIQTIGTPSASSPVHDGRRGLAAPPRPNAAAPGWWSGTPEEEPWIILTDLDPIRWVGTPCASGSIGLQGPQEPGLEVGPRRGATPPRLPALARPVGGHPALALWHQGGGRPGAEDCSAGNLRTPPKALAPITVTLGAVRRAP